MAGGMNSVMTQREPGLLLSAGASPALLDTNAWRGREQRNGALGKAAAASNRLREPGVFIWRIKSLGRPYCSLLALTGAYKRE